MDNAYTKRRPGDVFQINEERGRKGWLGAFVLAEKVEIWGIQGFVPHIHSHNEQHRIYIRLKWDQIDYVGRAALVSSDVADCYIPGGKTP